MMNFRKLAAASKGRALLRYFTEDTPEPIHEPGVAAAGRQLDSGGRLTAYYTGRDSRAAWRPDMPLAVARAIGIDPHRMPRDADMARLFEARRADTGESWSRQPRKLSGFDIVFSPHKSVSLAAEFAATPAESGAIWNAIDRAADATMHYIAREAGWARRGAGGQDGADPGAVGWISFRHHTARPTLPLQDGVRGPTYLADAPVAGDPHAHIHHFLMNLVVTDDGRVGSLDTRVLSQIRVKEFGAFFQAFLADELRRIGARIGYDAGEQAVVLLDIPQTAVDLFSKGRQQVLRKAKEFAASQGFDWDHLSIEAKLDMLRDAGATGRLGKPKNVERELWREQAAAIGWKHKTVMVAAEHDHLTDTERFDRAYTFAARHLAEEFHTAAALDHDKLRLYAARGLIGTGIRGGVGDIDRLVELIEQRGLRLRGEHVALIVGLFDDKVRVTNSTQVRIEETLAACAREAARDRSGGLSTEALRRAIATAGVRFTEAQIAAIYALGRSGKLTLLTGVAGAGKTTLLQPLVAAWRADTRFAAGGRDVIGAATAWRQADALRDAGIERTFALQPLLKMIEAGEFTPTRNTVLVLDEVSQIAPRPMLKLLELQADTGMTVKMLGDPEQAQAIEAGDTIEILRRVLPPEALPELLATIRQKTKRGRKIARLFRDGKAAEALFLKREEGTALMVGGDYDQVVAKIADLYIQRRDILRQAGNNKGVTVTALTNDEVADISRAIRARLNARGEIGQDEVVYRAIDQRGETYDLPIAIGDRLRLFRRTWGRIDGGMGSIGNNGDIVEVVGWSETGLLLRDVSGRVADAEWRRLSDEATNRLLVGFGHALTIDAAQGISSTEHINALTRGTSGVTAFKGYVAESRSEYTTWTVISEGAVYEAERHSRALGDITPITAEDLWTRAAADLSSKPYKSLGVDILAGARRDRDQAVDTFIRTRHAIETAQLDDPEFGHDTLKRFRAEAVRNTLSRHVAALDEALRRNAVDLAATRQPQQAHEHLMKLHAEAEAARRQLEAAAAPNQPPGWHYQTSLKPSV